MEDCEFSGKRAGAQAQPELAQTEIEDQTERKGGDEKRPYYAQEGY